MRKKFFNKYTVTGITDVGSVRQHNEDNILIDEQLNLLIVADGMGGHQAGEVASMEAVRVIQQMLQLQLRTVQQRSWLSRFFFGNKTGLTTSEIGKKIQSLEKALLEANHHIYSLNTERNATNGSGMGTTIAGCWLISENQMLVFHIGDSRIYRYGKKRLEVLSKDHSILQEWYSNDCIGDKPKSNVITRAVGPYAEVQPEIQTMLLDELDVFLLCSDGLTDMVEELDIEKEMLGLNAENCEDRCHKLLEKALSQGGSDNVSIIVMTQD